MIRQEEWLHLTFHMANS